MPNNSTKIIVTHFSPDLDAICSCWLISKYLPGWGEAPIKLVSSGTTLNGNNPDDDKNIIHVDTGFGMFDHHQQKNDSCAAVLVFQYLVKKDLIKNKDQAAIKHIVEFVREIDHFQEVFYPDPASVRYRFLLPYLIEGLKPVLNNDQKVFETSFLLLESMLINFKNYNHALSEIKNGFIFTSIYGKSLAIETKNEEIVKLAQKLGYSLVIRRDPERKSIRIKTIPNKHHSLKPIYQEIIKKDKKGSWYLHISENMLLNGSSHNPDLLPTALSLNQIIEIVKNI